MRPNSTNSHFAFAPSVELRRSKWHVPFHTTKTTFNNGDLIPIKALEVLPGDTIALDLSYVVRMSTPVKPVFDNCFLDVFAFFVPRRLTWVHWEEFMGANKNGPWDVSAPNYNLPQTKSPRQNYASLSLSGGPGYWFKEAPFNGAVAFTTQAEVDYYNRCVDRGVLYYASGNTGVLITTKLSTTSDYDGTKSYYFLYRGWDVGSLAQYMGFPIGSGCEVDSGYFRAYCLVWNEYFRDQNYMNPVNTDFSNDSDVQGVPCIPDINSGGYVVDPVRGGKPLQVARYHDYFSSALPEPQYGDAVQIPFDGVAPVKSFDFSDANFLSRFTLYNSFGNPSLVSNNSFLGMEANSTNVNTYIDTSSRTPGGNVYTNFGADVQSIAGTIMDLRSAFQVQKYLERSARYGRRYIEIILGQFGVVNPDYRLQRPEMLAWIRKPLQITQVLQTSSTDSVSPQGNTAAYSLTADKKSLFTFSATEHGILFVMTATRTSRSYQQSLPRWASRRKKLDFYFPVFAHLSEMPILGREIFCHYDPINVSSSYTYPTDVFGYQEHWAEYRYCNSIITGEFSSVGPQPLDFWHYGDFYMDDVYASDMWLFEGPENLDRTLAVTSDLAHQFQAEFGFDMTMVRCMPVNSIPGLADHF